MWIANFSYKHDCILGNRCRKFGISLQSVGFSVYKEDDRWITSSLHYMSGNESHFDDFISGLKQEDDVISLDRKGNTFFLLEKAEEKVAKFFSPKIIFVKPMVTDVQGVEHWEIGSWDKQVVSDFLLNAKNEIDNLKISKVVNVPLDTIFFPRLMPKITAKQRQAIDLAINEGYYSTPRKTDLRQLSALMNVSLSTYQQHLRAAEEKIVPNSLNYLK